MRKVFAALAAWLVLFAFATTADAETCTKSTATTVRWAAANDVLWSGCTADATDDFVISAGRVETSASFSIASLTINTDATFVGGAGTILTVSGSVRNMGGTWKGIGNVRYEGRVISAAVTGGATPTTDIVLPSTMTNLATTADFVVVRDDDPSDLAASISGPVQIGKGMPEAGKYRWNPEKWRWYPITAVSGATITISTDPFADVESSLPIGGTSTYSGTRGSALGTADTFTNVGRIGEGLYSELNIDLDLAASGAGADVAEDGDLSDQIVEVTSGACAGWRLGIHFVDAAATPTVDKIYVDGDTTRCGATFSATIHMGIGTGDRIAIVRPWTLRGSDTAHVEWSGGITQLENARLVRLDDQGASLAGTEDWSAACNVCIFRTSTTAPDFASSYFRDIEIAYGNTSATDDTASIGFMNFNSGATGFLTSGGVLNAAGFKISRYYTHDQANHDASRGIHGIWVQGVKNLEVAQYRCERNGDDCFYTSINDFSQKEKLPITLRHFIANTALSPGSQSQQCFDTSVGDRGTGENSEAWVQAGALKLSDARFRSCDDGNFVWRGLGAEFARITTAGSAGKGATAQPGVSIGALENLNNYPPDSALSLRPNLLMSSMVSAIGPAGTTGNVLTVGAEVSDSLFYGADTMTSINAYIINPVKFTRTYVNLGASSTSSRTILYRVNTTLRSVAVPTIYIRDSVFLKTVTDLEFCGRMDSATPIVSNFDVTRSFFGGTSVTTAGLISTCMTASSGDAQTFTADGLTISVTTLNNYGLGRGFSGEGTGEGSRITNALVETSGTLAPTSRYVYGANVTATSEASPLIEPDTGLGVSLRTFVAGPGDARRPGELGLSQLGTEQAMNGDAFLASPELWANKTLRQTLGVQ